MAYLATGLAAARGFQHLTPPLPAEEFLPELNAAIAERTARWESVLLLGDPQTILAARTWHQCLWELEHFARGELNDRDEFRLAWREFEQSRHQFYQAARAGLGVPGELPDVTWTPPWRARVGLSHQVGRDTDGTDTGV
ncbi:hypothetical protein [Dactylosporangium sp. CS-033363]|uniref:hypothetical protein n=1 Tax=Dactylosporangium sp. CS-033363 TaxID=3239935 RepID=UPI003D93D67A